ncbi:Aste57867_24924 [Aphanomyces stellatus]|uniref:Aste57867_24924 protein n=1 Tax=Aphanomyces stellatus TaxID=120398 RepID=A0A485LTU8_9STRA|nr:hypothetical protein As57867_024846 [Aphanomyces stellatus]VFU01556.1 Aste57867_24924 [Aphanomyces stellatus]
MLPLKCYFNGCPRPTTGDSIKCKFHNLRSICLVQDCRNQVFARNLCVRHGGKKTCCHDDCNENVRIGDLCGKHGAGTTRKPCIEPGCSKFAQSKMRCSAHGGGQRCKLDTCTAHARKGGYCTRHTMRQWWEVSNVYPMPSFMLADRTSRLSASFACASSSRKQPPKYKLHVSSPSLNKLSLATILNPTVYEV